MITLLEAIRRCTLCDDLPLGPRPVIRAQKTSKLLIIGQAPGTKVHQSGVPWDDASGDRLRDWLDLDKATFYDDHLIAIMPMGLCYPGRLEKGGDKPPHPICAPTWHDKVRQELTQIELTLLVGSYAQNYYLRTTKEKNMTDTVKNWGKYMQDGFFPLPHPSWRVTNLIKKNPWFGKDLLPDLRKSVQHILSS